MTTEADIHHAMNEFLRATTRLIQLGLADKIENMKLSIPDSHDTTQSTAKSNIEWPRLDPLDGSRDQHGHFMSPDFRRHWEPGESLWLYIAGCAGLKQLADTLQLPIFKIGTTGLDLLMVAPSTALPPSFRATSSTMTRDKLIHP